MDMIALLSMLALLAAAVWLARKVTEQLLSRELAVHQTKLRAEYDMAIERLRHDLRLAAVEREMRFSRLYEKKLEVLGELYRRMARSEKAFADCTNPKQLGSEEEQEQRRKHAATCGNEFADYLNENDVYLDPRLVKPLREILGTFRLAWTEFLSEPKGSAWTKVWDEYKSRALPLRENIRKEVQRILEGKLSPEPHSP